MMGYVETLMEEKKAVEKGNCQKETALVWAAIDTKGILESEGAMFEPQVAGKGGTLWQWFSDKAALAVSGATPEEYKAGFDDLVSRGLVREGGSAHPGMHLAYVSNNNQ